MEEFLEALVSRDSGTYTDLDIVQRNTAGYPVVVRGQGGQQLRVSELLKRALGLANDLKEVMLNEENNYCNDDDDNDYCNELVYYIFFGNVCMKKITVKSIRVLRFFLIIR